MTSLLRSSIPRIRLAAPKCGVGVPSGVSNGSCPGGVTLRRTSATATPTATNTTSSTVKNAAHSGAAAIGAGASARAGGKAWFISLNDALKLSKHRLSGLVAFTAGAGYVCRVNVDEWGDELSEDAKSRKYYRQLGATTVGTWLTAACANTLNQVYERHSDKLMQRTRGRPLPAGRVGLVGALAFAVATGLAGVSVLGLETNGAAAGLAGANAVLYAGVYTPLKAVSVANTWVGAVVGALPPLVGWAAAHPNSSAALTELCSPRESAGAWTLASLLFLWQIPHFHALAVALRKDYANAGLRMLAVSDPAANAAWARRTAALLLPIGPMLHASGVATEPFVWTSTALSIWMLREAGKLCMAPRCTVAARQVFRASIWHLPLCLGLLLVNLVPASQRSATEQANINERQTLQAHQDELIFHAPWEVMAPFPFLPVPRGPPSVVIDRSG